DDAKIARRHPRGGARSGEALQIEQTPLAVTDDFERRGRRWAADGDGGERLDGEEIAFRGVGERFRRHHADTQTGIAAPADAYENRGQIAPGPTGIGEYRLDGGGQVPGVRSHRVKLAARDQVKARRSADLTATAGRFDQQDL